jgi:hypothetical protein
MADNNYQEFNNFQTLFYTNISKFNDFSLFEFKRHGFVLLNNLAKGYPNLANIILNLKGIDWEGPKSPGVLKALQRKFVNNFNSTRIPQFIYYKTEKIEKSKEKTKQTDKGLLFDIEIQSQICSILMIDSKTYDYLKFSDNIQYLGKQINGEFIQRDKIKAKTTKKKK